MRYFVKIREQFVEEYGEDFLRGDTRFTNKEGRGISWESTGRMSYLFGIELTKEQMKPMLESEDYDTWIRIPREYDSDDYWCLCKEMICFEPSDEEVVKELFYQYSNKLEKLSNFLSEVISDEDI